jgi:hypothetical protein
MQSNPFGRISLGTLAPYCILLSSSADRDDSARSLIPASHCSLNPRGRAHPAENALVARTSIVVLDFPQDNNEYNSSRSGGQQADLRSSTEVLFQVIDFAVREWNGLTGVI